MPSWLPPAPLLLAFCAASAVLALTPGPAVFYILTRTLSQGRRAGMASVAGVAAGNLGNAAGASLGLAALFAVSSWAFTIVKFAGAAYLLYLGIRTLRSWDDAGLPAAAPASGRRLVRDGFLVALLNPKTALFFAAFLPQFVEPGARAAAQSLALGVLFVLIAACTDAGYVMGAGTIAARLSKARAARAWGRRLSATAFIGLAAFTALGGMRATR